MDTLEDYARILFRLGVSTGFDFQVSKNGYVNVDVKKAFIDSDLKLKASGAKVSHIRIDPILLRVGFGWRF